MKIAIDPGHGMGNRRKGVFDPGAVCQVGDKVFQEADVVLKYGLALRNKLKALGHEVFMTRTDNIQDTPLLKRTQRAEAEGCEAIISLHNNAHSDTSINGLEIYYKGSGAQRLANLLQSELVKTTKMRDRGIREVTANVPQVSFNGIAILVELGFITNAQDRAVLLDETKGDHLCEGICQVVNSAAQQQAGQSAGVSAQVRQSTQARQS